MPSDTPTPALTRDDMLDAMRVCFDRQGECDRVHHAKHCPYWERQPNSRHSAADACPFNEPENTLRVFDATMTERDTLRSEVEGLRSDWMWHDDSESWQRTAERLTRQRNNAAFLCAKYGDMLRGNGIHGTFTKEHEVLAWVERAEPATPQPPTTPAEGYTTDGFWHADESEFTVEELCAELLACALGEGANDPMELAAAIGRKLDSLRERVETADRLLELVDFNDDEEACDFDHHGLCQTHGCGDWGDRGDTPHCPTDALRLVANEYRALKATQTEEG